MHLPLTDPWRDALSRDGYTVVTEGPGGAVATANTSTAGLLTVRRGDTLAAVTIVPLADSQARAGCADHLTRWQPVDDPEVEQLVDAVDLGDAVALLRAADGQSLADFVSTNGRLSAGQTSTILVVLGRALARLHSAGLVYGPMTAHDVRLVSGQPRLVVPLPPISTDHSLPASPTEDAYHLAALADSVVAAAYGPEASAHPAASLRALRRVIVSALGDASSRPGVGTLATTSHDVAACQPIVELAPPALERPDEDRIPSPPRTGLRRRGLLVLAIATLVLAGAGKAWWTEGRTTTVEAADQAAQTDGPSSGTTGAPSPKPSPKPPDGPAAAAEDLTRARFELIARLTAADPDIDARGWSDVTVLGSPAHLQALDLVAGLVADGSTVSGLSTTVESSIVLDSTPTTARVEVVYSTSEYAVRGARGNRVVPAATSQPAVLTLTRTGDGWRVSDVAPAS